jgi:hypothetical protein
MHLSWEYVPKVFALSLFDMAQYAAGKYNLGIITNGGCYGDSSRDNIARKAMKYNPDYILWLDADQTYPANTPEILMKHIDDGKLVVGGVSPLKKKSDNGLDGKPSIWDLDIVSNRVRHREIFLHQGLVKVEGMGLGGIMVNPEVFKTMEYPWFRRVWNENEKVLLGADFSFYANCKKAGIDVWCDTDLIFGHMEVRPIELKEKKRLLI